MEQFRDRRERWHRDPHLYVSIAEASLHRASNAVQFDTVQKSEESQHVLMSNQLHGLSQNQRTQKAKICALNKRD